MLHLLKAETFKMTDMMFAFFYIKHINLQLRGNFPSAVMDKSGKHQILPLYTNKKLYIHVC